MELEPQLCRLCLVPVDPAEVVVLNQAVDVIGSILQITTINVLVDPSIRMFICQQCQQELDRAIQFRTMCVKNDETFRRMCNEQMLPLNNFKTEPAHWEAEFVQCKIENEYDETVDQCNSKLETPNFEVHEADPKLRSQNLETTISPNKSNKKSNINPDLQLPFQETKTKKPRKKYIVPHKPRSNRVYVKVPCQICGGFFNRDHIREHLLIHSENRPMHECTQCPKKYRYKKNLKEHIEIVHEGNGQHACDICGKTYNRKGPLKTHYIAEHTDIKKFDCKVCGKLFARSASRNNHFKINHTNLRPYSCEFCAMTFKRKNDLTIHIRTHTGEKPYKCDLCDKTFAKSYNVIIHKKSHKNAEMRRAAQLEAETTAHGSDVSESAALF